VVTSLAKYVTLVAVVGFISYLILTYLNRTMGIPILPAKLIAEGLLFLANFAIQRQLVFVRSKLNKSEAA
jgi:putative flippase GtrA